MNFKEIKQSLTVLRKHKKAPFIWGSQGIGKTEMVTQFCEENDLNMITLHCSTQEVGDLIGLLTKNEETGKVYHSMPEWFPTSGKGVIFLDELNLAPPDVLKPLYPFILKGTLHTHQLPSTYTIIAAGNYQSDRFDVTDTSSAAFISRFAHIDATPTVEEWLVYAEKHGHFDMADFIREQPSMLELSASDAGRLDLSMVVPDRRSAISVAEIDSDPSVPEDIKYELFSGMIGTVSAAAYMVHKSKKEKGLALRDILGSYPKVRNKVREISSSMENIRFDLLNQPIDELILKIEDNPQFLSSNGYLENLKSFLLDIPIELSTKAFTKLGTISSFMGKDDILNNKEYATLIANK